MVQQPEKSVKIHDYLSVRHHEHTDFVCLSINLFGDSGCRLAEECVKALKKYATENDHHGTLVISYPQTNTTVNNFFTGRCCFVLGDIYETIALQCSKDNCVVISSKHFSAGKRVQL